MSLLKDISNIKINEEKAPSNDEEWEEAELKAWKERFKGAKSKTVAEFRKEFPRYKYRRQDDTISLKLSEEMSLLKELSVVNKTGSVQTDLKKSDATDAGKSDVVDKATASQDIGFNLMRNTINADGKVSGSDIANYIEKAEELNDEVDTVPFGLETDDGQIVKVYVNAEQADKFEEAMKNMLGLEDDIEEAINRLTTEFDIVDVVWPTSDEEEEGEEDSDADLSIDDTSGLDSEDDEDFADDQYDVVASVDDDETEQAKSDQEETASEDDELDDEGKPKKVKKKKPQPPEPAEDEGTNRRAK